MKNFFILTLPLLAILKAHSAPQYVEGVAVLDLKMTPSRPGVLPGLKPSTLLHFKGSIPVSPANIISYQFLYVDQLANPGSNPSSTSHVVLPLQEYYCDPGSLSTTATAASKNVSIADALINCPDEKAVKFGKTALPTLNPPGGYFVRVLYKKWVYLKN
jgi:hypothetical protein